MNTDPAPTQWVAPSRQPCLDANNLHVYRIDLVGQAALESNAAQLLSDAERARAERYRSPRDRSRHVVAHVALRLILSRYLGLDPAQLRFGSGVAGKPHLASDACALDLRFSLAHSGDLALLAIALGHEVGVDVELAASPTDVLSTARTAFAPQEYDALLALPEAQRQRAFYRLWTHKEAYLKATGAGMSFPMDAFAISISEHEPARLLWVKDRPQELQRWSFLQLTAHPEYAAAVAVDGRAWRLHCYHLAG